jgi:DNA-binding response OmpR family regulator
MLCDDVAATLHGFDRGAEDVLPHTTAPAEVRARIRVVVRRRRRDAVIRYGDLTVDFTARVAFLGAEALPLSGLEFDVLAWLAGHPHRVWARRDLVERAWPGWRHPPERSVDVRIRNLRVALGDDVRRPTFIETVRGRGYRWIHPPDDVPPGFTDP